MFRISKRLAQAAEPISRCEFLDAIAEISPAAASLRDNGGLPLALAISGGVDSMALASMCRTYLPENGTTLHALVVDHGLRATSHDEARKVKQLLTQRLQIETQILPIKLHESPMTATNVETFARKMRFQALGGACKVLGSSLLLLGHHYDDQAETLFMRMVDGHTAKLIGIQKIANIPECYGLHGISGSGSHLTLQPSQLPRDCGVTGLERGGIQLGRPLLNFSKNRLLATCQKLNMPWFEDETNSDRTLTSRNAVRHIVDKYRLPQALGSKSLVALGERKRCNLEQRERVVDKLFDDMPLALDLRSGVVTVEFPRLLSAIISPLQTPEVSSSGTFGKQSHDRGHRSTYSTTLSSALVYYMLVKRIAGMSYSGVLQTTGRFNDVVNSIYSISNGWAGSFYRPSNLKTEPPPKILEASGLCFERIEDVQGKNASMKWRIYRAPPKQGEAKFANEVPLPSRSFQLLAPTSKLEPSQEDSFSLWDDRYWIRVHNPAQHDLWVRKLDEDSLASLRPLLSAGRVVLRRQSNGEVVEDGRGYLRKLLRETAKGIIRWSLPVIVSYIPLSATDTVNVPVNIPQILAFPTLDLRVESVSWPTWVSDLKWEVRYKRIDLGNKKLEDCLVGGGKSELELVLSPVVKARWETPLSGGKT
ncbi:putative amino-acid permease [Venturia nashicola]|uniref:tRNA(Ile)-lysidine synthetase n=1 Tax=Venturia nashicola TaxID=86259 RepID=A0A4Z1P2L2_9PEZI|nr:putative amino-acid permease [Venturia nashicola]TLD34738.1 putative amino-acid permease [Venturia nashicola]